MQAAAKKLLNSLETNAPSRDREIEAAKGRERAKKRYERFREAEPA